MVQPPQRRMNRAQRAERDAKIFNPKIAGVPEREIGREVGLSQSRVNAIVQAEVARRIGVVSEEYADHREAELTALWRAAYREQVTAKSTTDRLKAIDTARRINESRRKLRGADAPVEIKAQLDMSAQLTVGVITTTVAAVVQALTADRSMPAHLIEKYALEYATYELTRLSGEDPGDVPQPQPRVVAGRVLSPGTSAHHAADDAARPSGGADVCG